MDFKLFTDKELKNQVDNTIDLGKLKTGEKKTYEFYIQNVSPYPYEELHFSSDNSEIKILSFPKQLGKLSSGILTLEWTPSVDIKEGLKARLEIHGYKIVS